MKARIFTAAKWFALVGAVLLVTAPLWSVGLTCDDFSYAAASHEPGGWLARAGALTRPVSSFILVKWLAFGDVHRWALPAVRILHHLVNALGVMAVGRLGWGLKPPFAYLSGLAFALWGSHGELGFYSSLHDQLATSFILLTLYLVAAGKSGYLPVLLAALGAYLCKETAFVLPGMIALLPFERGTAGAEVSWRRKLAGVSVVGLLVVLASRGLLIGQLRGELEPSIYRDPSLPLMGRSLVKLLIRCLVPGATDVQASFLWLRGAGRIYGVPACGLLMWGVAWAWGQRPAWWRRWVLGFGLALAPVCMLSVSLSTGENSRYLYFPAAFVAWLLAALCQQARRAGTPRVPLALAITSLLFLQAAGQHQTARRYAVASAEVERYRGALTTFLAQHPDAQHVAIACAPDNFLGAFSARNASSSLASNRVGMHWSSPAIDVLASVYEDAPSSAGCTWAWQNGCLQLRSCDGRATLTHPALLGIADSAGQARWQWRAAHVTRQGLTDSLSVTSRQSPGRGDLMAVWQRGHFECVN